MRHQIDIIDFSRAMAARSQVQIGHYFIFVEAGVDAPTDAAQGAARRPGERHDRFSRLLAKQGSARGGGPQVIALTDSAVECAGVRITPASRGVMPVGCVVTDRDLYRAEDDVANLLCALPGGRAGKRLRLILEQNGQALTERDIELDAQGLCVENLAAMTAGSYSAQLELDGVRIGEPARFSAAEYTLAPLSGRLLTHTIDRVSQRLAFELQVESYQQPFADKLAVALIDAGREVKHTKVKAHAPGRYRGEIKLKGEGPFRLRLSAIDDAERVAEVALPGSRAAERDQTVISELGRERLFSMLPEPGALPLRGGFVAEGDAIATPLRVDEIVCAQRVVHVERAVAQLTAVSLDLTRGTLHLDALGDVDAGSAVEVPAHGALSTVFLGGLIGGQPFEGYTTFAAPAQRALSLAVADTARPGDELRVELSVAAAGAGPQTDPASAAPGGGGPYRSAGKTADAPLTVLLAVRDERLTATDPPDVALGAAAKRGIDAAVEGMADEGLTSLELAMPMPPPVMYSAAIPMSASTLTRAGSLPPPGAMPAGGAYDYDDDLVLAESAAAPMMQAEDAPLGAVRCRAADATLDTGAFEPVAQRCEAALDEPHEGAGEDALSEPPSGETLSSGDLASRRSLPEQLFYGLVTLSDGRATVKLPLPDSLATFTVEAFALLDGDWQRQRAAVVVDQPVRVDLELPPAIHPGDGVVGRLRAASGSGQLRVSLERDGVPVVLDTAKGQTVAKDATLRGPIELSFAAAPGQYKAVVEDVDSGETDRLEREVTEPGKLRYTARELGLMQRGDAITLESANALSLRVLPGLDEPFGMLTRATAGYAHLCCEQTAAKILAAVLMYLVTDKAVERKLAERIILAGVARERTMRAPGQGFLMYPGERYVSDYYSRLAVRYLWTLRQLQAVDGLPPSLVRAAAEGVELADAAGKDHGISAAPRAPLTIAEAYAAATTEGGDHNAARAFLGEALQVEGKQVTLREPEHAVADRAALAYGAAGLLALGELKRGLVVANVVTRQLNEQGALYSTVDSAAAIALLIELRKARVLAEGGGRLKVNGREMSAAEAAELGDQVESVEVLEGVAAVEVCLLREENWSDFGSGVTLKVGLRAGASRVSRVRPGQRLDLRVELPGGYTPGDLVHVMLPAALSRIEAGAKVKRFSVDFEGKQELSVPLVATSEVDGKQHFAVCLRNMFEEERAASPGLIAVEG
jgi:hypothetical protein